MAALTRFVLGNRRVVAQFWLIVTVIGIASRNTSRRTVMKPQDSHPSMIARIVTAASRSANKRGLYLGPRATTLHVAVYRVSRGRLAGHIPGMPAARILLLEHTGARTGTRRVSPVMYHQDGDAIAIAASKGGQPSHPAWFHNLKAHPDATIQIAGVKRPVRARIATDEEREHLWPKFLAFYPDYDFFQRLAAPRQIPVMILEPRQSNHADS